MSETDGSTSDVRQLRRGLRDLAAISAMPVVWTESDPRRIAESLADALLHMLHLELVYILVRDRAYEIPVEVAHTARGPAPTAQAEEIGRALDPWLNTSDLSRTPSSIANPLGNGMTRIICPPFGIEARGGVLVACSPRADFPSEVDRLLLGVAANQVAILLDRRRTEDALRESEERFRGTFENAGVGIADCDRIGDLRSGGHPPHRPALRASVGGQPAVREGRRVPARSDRGGSDGTPDRRLGGWVGRSRPRGQRPRRAGAGPSPVSPEPRQPPPRRPDPGR